MLYPAELQRRIGTGEIGKTKPVPHIILTEDADFVNANGGKCCVLKEMAI